MTIAKSRFVLPGGYQETLRVIGAWLDARGVSQVRIEERSGALTIEAMAGATPRRETVRLDHERIERLRAAALADRGGALSMPIQAD
jgi:hypothetical protein